MQTRRVVLCDFSWLCYRYYFSPLHKRMSVELEGRTVNTGNLYGFGQLVRAASLQGGQIVFCEDVGVCSTEGVEMTPERTQIYNQYKAGRQEHPEVWENYDHIQKIVCCHPEVHFSNSPGLEADDVMAIHFFRFKQLYPEAEIIIYSGDNDLLQLMPYGAKIARAFADGDFEFVGSEYLKEKFPGVSPENILRYRVLVGDPSDNIKPVVPRLNRVFIKSFIECWRQKGLGQALQDYKHDPNGQKLILNRLALARNIDLMNLTKYRDPRIWPQNVGLYRKDPDHSLLDKYRLEKFKTYLSELKMRQTA